jgi:hypothetical protein
MKETLAAGARAGLQTTWTLGKVIFPVTIFISLLQHTPVMGWIIKLISPVMGIFGLSGEAAIPLVIGNILNLYAGIAAIFSLELSVKEVFTLAIMLSFCHNLIIESTVAIKVGIKFWIVLAVRIGLAIFSGILVHLIWQGGHDTAQYGFVSASKAAAPEGWLDITIAAFMKAGMNILQLAAIIIPLMIIIQIMRDKGWLQVFSSWIAPFVRLLGMKENTSMTMVAGLTIGLAYGAGVMIKAVEEDGVSQRDITLAFIFLVACHAVVEDTLVFIPLGIPVWPLLLIRLSTALLLTMAIAYFWKNKDFQSAGKGAVYES